MTLSELQARVDYRRRDTTQTFISTTEITAYLNEALRKINAYHDWDFNATSVTFAYTAGTTTYSLPVIITADNFKSPIAMEYPSNLDYKFTIITKRDFDKLYQESLNIYATVGDNLYVKTSFGTATLQLRYYATSMAYDSAGLAWADELSAANDYPLMPEYYQDMLVDFAAARCYQKEGLTDDYTIAINDFNRSLQQMKTDYPSEAVKPLKRMTLGSQYGATDGEMVDKSNPLGI